MIKVRETYLDAGTTVPLKKARPHDFSLTSKRKISFNIDLETRKKNILKP